MPVQVTSPTALAVPTRTRTAPAAVPTLCRFHPYRDERSQEQPRASGLCRHPSVQFRQNAFANLTSCKTIHAPVDVQYALSEYPFHAVCAINTIVVDSDVPCQHQPELPAPS